VGKVSQDCQVVGQHCQVLFLTKIPVNAVFFFNIAKIAKSYAAAPQFSVFSFQKYFHHNDTTAQ